MGFLTQFVGRVIGVSDKLSMGSSPRRFVPDQHTKGVTVILLLFFDSIKRTQITRRGRAKSKHV